MLLHQRYGPDLRLPIFAVFQSTPRIMDNLMSGTECHVIQH